MLNKEEIYETTQDRFAPSMLYFAENKNHGLFFAQRQEEIPNKKNYF